MTLLNVQARIETMRTCWGKASWRRQSRTRGHNARQLDLSREKFCPRRFEARPQEV